MKLSEKAALVLIPFLFTQSRERVEEEVDTFLASGIIRAEGHLNTQIRFVELKQSELGKLCQCLSGVVKNQ